MNKQNFFMQIVNHRKRVKQYDPAWTVAEMAREFGVSTLSLRQMIARNKDAPKPVIDNSKCCSGRGKALLYNSKELRNWCKNKFSNGKVC